MTAVLPVTHCTECVGWSSTPGQLSAYGGYPCDCLDGYVHPIVVDELPGVVGPAHPYREFPAEPGDIVTLQADCDCYAGCQDCDIEPPSGKVTVGTARILDIVLLVVGSGIVADDGPPVYEITVERTEP